MMPDLTLEIDARAGAIPLGRNGRWERTLQRGPAMLSRTVRPGPNRFARRAAIAVAFAANASCLLREPAAPLPSGVHVDAGADDVVIDLMSLENGAPDTIEVCLRDVVIVSDAGGVDATPCGFPNLSACLVMEAYTRVRDAPFHSGGPCPHAQAGPARVIADISFRRKRERGQEPWRTATLLTSARIDVE